MCVVFAQKANYANVHRTPLCGLVSILQLLLYNIYYTSAVSIGKCHGNRLDKHAHNQVLTPHSSTKTCFLLVGSVLPASILGNRKNPTLVKWHIWKNMFYNIPSYSTLTLWSSKRSRLYDGPIDMSSSIRLNEIAAMASILFNCKCKLISNLISDIGGTAGRQFSGRYGSRVRSPTFLIYSFMNPLP
jgi:hypothetical protein